MDSVAPWIGLALGYWLAALFAIGGEWARKRLRRAGPR